MTRSEPATGQLAPHEPQSTGGWTWRDAAHLLARAQFGTRYEEIQESAQVGLETTLDRLLRPQRQSAEFLQTEAILLRAAHDSAAIADLKAWWVYRMLYSANPLVEKMTLFWHNHFATSNAKVRSVAYMAAQNGLIRRYALGSFRECLHGMARDVAMLIWLDGNANRKRHANENFARELMELFSLGVGNYTEKDIKEAARAFTGWHVRAGKFWFDSSQHDNGVKRVLGRSGDLDGGDVVDICLAQSACPQFLARKLLRSFVIPEPKPELVAQLAGRIRAHDFAVGKVLRELLSSRLFFGAAARSAIIKSPVDFVLGSQRALGVRANLQATVRLLAQLGQDVFEPPTVKGWDGGRLWINSGLLLKRANFAADLTTGSSFGQMVDPFETFKARGLTTPESAIQYYLDLLLARDVDRAALDRLEAYLRDAAGDRSQRLRGLVHLIMTMPEYQLG